MGPTDNVNKPDDDVIYTPDECVQPVYLASMYNEDVYQTMYNEDVYQTMYNDEVFQKMCNCDLRCDRAHTLMQIPLDGHFQGKLNIFDRSVKTLFDTGSTLSLISTKLKGFLQDNDCTTDIYSTDYPLKLLTGNGKLEIRAARVVHFPITDTSRRLDTQINAVFMDPANLPAGVHLIIGSATMTNINMTPIPNSSRQLKLPPLQLVTKYYFSVRNEWSTHTLFIDGPPCAYSGEAVISLGTKFVRMKEDKFFLTPYQRSIQVTLCNASHANVTCFKARIHVGKLTFQHLYQPQVVVPCHLTDRNTLSPCKKLNLSAFLLSQQAAATEQQMIVHTSNKQPISPRQQTPPRPPPAQERERTANRFAVLAELPDSQDSEDTTEQDNAQLLACDVTTEQEHTQYNDSPNQPVSTKKCHVPIKKNVATQVTCITAHENARQTVSTQTQIDFDLPTFSFPNSPNYEHALTESENQRMDEREKFYETYPKDRFLDHFPSFKNVKPEILPKLQDLLYEFRTIFYLDGDESLPTYLPPVKAEPLKFFLKPGSPAYFKSKPFSGSTDKAKLLHKEIIFLESCGIIRKIYQPKYVQSLVAVAKKDRKSIRLCHDLRFANSHIQNETQHMPHLPQVLRLLTESYTPNATFCKFDLHSAFFQFKISEEIIPYLAFEDPITHQYFSFQRCAQGLISSASHQNKILKSILAPLKTNTDIGNLHLYCDDLVCQFRAQNEDALQYLKHLFTLLKAFNITVSARKTDFFVTELNYLSYKICNGTISPSDRRITQFKALPIPTTRQELKSSICKMAYFRNQVANFAGLCKELFTEAYKSKHEKFIMTPALQEQFIKLKTTMCTANILQLPKEGLNYCLFTDASSKQIAAILTQVETFPTGKTVYHPIKVFSKQLNKSQANWSVNDAEIFALATSLVHFSKIIQFPSTMPLHVVTDSKTAYYLVKSTNKEINQMRPRLVRLLCTINSFHITISLVNSKSNMYADSLSRMIDPEANTSIDLEKLIEERLETPFQQSQTRLDEISEDTPPALFTLIVNNYHNSLDFRSMDAANIKTHQRADKFYRNLIAYLETHQLLDADERMAREIKATFHDYTIQDGLLYRQGLSNNKGIRLLLVIPATLRAAIITAQHLTLNHAGAVPTIYALREHFFIPAITRHVKQHLKRCAICQQCKLVPHYRSLGQHTWPCANGPMDRLFIDVFFPGYNTQILLVLDHFSRYVFLLPIKRLDASYLFGILFERIFTDFGMPNTLVTDSQSSFTSSFFHEACRLCNIKLEILPPFTQHRNLSERSIQTIKKSIRLLQVSGPQGILNSLPTVALAYNNAYSSAVNACPAYLFHRRLIKALPVYATIPALAELPQNHVQPFESVIQNLVTLYQQSLAFAEEKNKTRELSYCKTVRETYSKGDLVWQYVASEKCFRGPFMISDVFQHGNYQLCDPHSLKKLTHTTNIKFLKPYVDPLTVPTLTDEELQNSSLTEEPPFVSEHFINPQNLKTHLARLQQLKVIPTTPNQAPIVSPIKPPTPMVIPQPSLVLSDVPVTQAISDQHPASTVNTPTTASDPLPPTDAATIPADSKAYTGTGNYPTRQRTKGHQKDYTQYLTYRCSLM